jgi:hypothetical protein
MEVRAIGSYPIDAYTSITVTQDLYMPQRIVQIL